MRQFRKNALRLALRNKGSFFGGILIIGIGIFVLVSMMDTLRNLRDQIDAYYERQQMAEVFATVRGIPEADLRRMEELPGIRVADGKPAKDVRILFDGIDGIVTVRLMGIRDGMRLNIPAVSGEEPEDDVIFLGSRMESVYRFEPGDEIRVLIDGVSHRFRYGGICASPDYIYSFSPGGSEVPDGRVYDIACISAEKMHAMLGTGALHELGFKLENGSAYHDVRHEIAEYLEPYGLEMLVPFEDQASQSMIHGEYNELTATGTVLPVIFMAISVFMLYVVLRKMIDRDQSLIGTMKAFGMTDRELIGAYLVQGLVIGAGGAILGALTAGILGRYMFSLYVEFFTLPDTVYHDYADSRLLGLIIALISSLAAVWFGIRRILHITPAMAMRQRPPENGSAAALPAWLAGRVDVMGRMALRSMLRNPFRGFLIVLAVAFPFAMSSVLLSFGDVVEEMVSMEFSLIENYDIQVSLDHYESPERVRSSGENLAHVTDAEAVCLLPAELLAGGRREYATVTGLNRGSGLWRIADSESRIYDPPEDGVLLNVKLAEKLGVSEGDTIEVLFGSVSPDRRRVRVSGVLQEPFGKGCYAELAHFPDVFGIKPAANQLILRCEDGRVPDVIRRLSDAGRVYWITNMGQADRSYRDMMGSMTIMIHAFAVLAVIAGGILIYNISMINIRERATEFSTLRIIGVSRREAARMLLWEHAVLFILGILLGLPGNAAIRRILEVVMLSDSYQIRLRLYPEWCIAAAAVCLAITWVVFRLELSFIWQMPMTDALKERE